MKIKCLLAILLAISLGEGCTKPLNTIIATSHAGVVLATCPIEPSSTEVAVKLDNKDPLSFNWTNPKNDSIYHNVIVTFNPILRKSIGKTFTYSTVRRPTIKDTLANLHLPIASSIKSYILIMLL